MVNNAAIESIPSHRFLIFRHQIDQLAEDLRFVLRAPRAHADGRRVLRARHRQRERNEQAERATDATHLRHPTCLPSDL